MSIRRVGVVAAVVMGLNMGAGTAFAEEPAQAPAAAPVPAAEPARPPGTVRVQFRAYKPTLAASLFAGRPDGSYVLVCESPCQADVVPGTPLRVTLAHDDENGHDFVMHGTAGDTMNVEARPASKGALAGGIVMISIGGLTALIGLVLVAVAAGPHVSNDSELRTGGLITLAIGGGLTAGGLALILNRSKEPRIRQTDRVADHFVTTPAIGRAPTPLTWAFTF